VASAADNVPSLTAENIEPKDNVSVFSLLKPS